MISYKIPAESGKTHAPEFIGYCEHCHGYQWHNWYHMRIKESGHEFAACMNCHQISERDRFLIKEFSK